MKLSKICALAGAVAAFGLPLVASAALSCNDPGVGAAESIGGEYCTNNFGAATTWYIPPVLVNDASKDLLSGDDAVFLRWDGMPGATTTTFLTDKLDAGHLGVLGSLYVTGSHWTVSNALTGAGTPTTTSSIRLDLGGGASVDVAITTHIDDSGRVVQTYKVTNNSASALNNLSFGDLLNFHPYGSATGYNLGTTKYVDGTIVAYGNAPDPWYLTNGWMSLGVNGTKVTPTAWDVVAYGPLTDPWPAAAAINEVNCLITGLPGACFSDVSGPITGDVAGILAYDYGILEAGASVTFDIFKAPEPASMALLGLGLIGLIGSRRRRAVASA